MLLEDLAYDVLEHAKRAQVKIATAESCTGGMVGASLTAIPNSSVCYLGGFVTYANSAKQKLLSVPEECLQIHGAVSPETAHFMAEGCSQQFEGALSIAITGIAGPGGGSPEKPVGLVYIATSQNNQTQVEKHIFTGSRQEVRHAAAMEALKQVLTRLQ